MRLPKLLTLALLAAASVSALAPGSAAAAPGDLDTTFGLGGTVSVPQAARFYDGTLMAVQSNGGVLLVGGDWTTGDGTVSRFTSSGTLDTNFGTGGTVDVPGMDGFTHVAVQPDGKIVVLGYDLNSGSYVARYLEDGTFDPNFNGGSRVYVPVYGYGGAQHSMLVVRADGSILAFPGGTGSDYGDMAIIDASGHLINGPYFETWWSNGGPPIAAAPAADGRYLFATNSGGYYGYGTLGITAMNADFSGGSGTVDTGIPLEVNGSYTPLTMAMQADGKLLVAVSTYGPNYSSNIALARVTAAGQLDSTFGTGGVAHVTNAAIYAGQGGGGDPTALLGQSDGKIVLAAGPYVYRLLADGTLDQSFGIGGKFASSLDSVVAVGQDAAGHLLLGGTRSGVLAAARIHAEYTPPANAGGSAGPTITGTAAEARTLTAHAGTWTGDGPIAFGYQWQRCTPGCADIAGATGATYTLAAADVDATITLVVTATNPAAIPVTASSATTAAVAVSAPINTAVPAVTGATSDGALLTAVPGTWVGTGPITVSDQWQRCTPTCTDIANATANTYTLSAADVGATIRVVELAGNSVATGLAANSAQTATITAVAPSNSALPTISGMTTDGSTLTAAAGTWTGTAPITVTRKWQRCSPGCADIAGETGTTYVLAAADVNAKVRVVETADNVAVGVTTAASAQTAAVAALAPANTAVPTITGAVADGQTLTAVDGTWTGTAPITLAHQWQRCTTGCVDIAGETSATYVLAAGDVGATIRVVETADNAAVGTHSAQSAQTAAVTAVAPSVGSPPTISGAAVDGATLAAVAGTWTGTTPIAVTRQWQRCNPGCVDVAGATGTTYVLGAGEIGSTFRFVETADNVAAGTAIALSAPTASVAAAAPTNTVLPTVTGAATEGSTLTATAGAWSGTAPITIVRQWQRCSTTCTDIVGANGVAYLLTAADLGRTIRVVEMADNVAAAGVTSVSVPTATVAAPPVPPAPPAPPVVTVAPPIASTGGDTPRLTITGSSVPATCALVGAAVSSCTAQVVATVNVTDASGHVTQQQVVLATGSATSAGSSSVAVPMRLTTEGSMLLATSPFGRFVTITLTARPVGAAADVTTTQTIRVFALVVIYDMRLPMFSNRLARLQPSAAHWLDRIAPSMRSARSVTCTAYAPATGSTAARRAARSLALARAKSTCARIRLRGVPAKATLATTSKPVAASSPRAVQLTVRR